MVVVETSNAEAEYAEVDVFDITHQTEENYPQIELDCTLVVTLDSEQNAYVGPVIVIEKTTENENNQMTDAQNENGK